MFTCYRATHFNAHAKNPTGHCFGTFERTVFATIEQNERMQIPIARVEHICATQASLARHLTNPTQCFAQSAARYDTVLHNEIWR